MLDSNFMIGLKVFMHSFLKHNQWFDWDLVIMDTGLTDKDKEDIEKIYPVTRYISPKYENYTTANMSNTHDRLKKTYYFLDTFTLNEYGYDKVVSMDVDMLVLGNMKQVFLDSCDKGFSACESYFNRKDKIINQINAGLFVIGKDYLNQGTYEALLGIIKEGFSMPEQKTMNIYFKGRTKILHKRYNMEKRIFHSKRYQNILKNAVVIHYVGTKPWEDHTKFNKEELRYAEWESLWIREYKEMKGKQNG